MVLNEVEVIDARLRFYLALEAFCAERAVVWRPPVLAGEVRPGGRCYTRFPLRSWQTRPALVCETPLNSTRSLP